MTVITQRGRIYKLVGTWDSDLVFAPDDGLDDQVMIYSKDEVKELLKQGKLCDVTTGQNAYPN